MAHNALRRFPRIVTILGVVLVVLGMATQILSLRLGLSLPTWELRVATDFEALGIGLWWIAAATWLVVPRRSTSRGGSTHPIYVTQGLLDALLARAVEAEPRRVSLALEATPAHTLETSRSLDSTQPVFTHFVHPSAGKPVRSVFGIDLATSPGRTQGRFVSHPQHLLRLTKRDDLHEVVLIAVPPWDADCVAAFDRSGRRLPLRVVEATPTEATDETLLPTPAELA